MNQPDFKTMCREEIQTRLDTVLKDQKRNHAVRIRILTLRIEMIEDLTWKSPLLVLADERDFMPAEQETTERNSEDFKKACSEYWKYYKKFRDFYKWKILNEEGESYLMIWSKTEGRMVQAKEKSKDLYKRVKTEYPLYLELIR